MTGHETVYHRPADQGPEVVECNLLLPAWQADALLRVAFARGTTAGQLVRRLIGDYLARVESSPDSG